MNTFAKFGALFVCLVTLAQSKANAELIITIDTSDSAAVTFLTTANTSFESGTTNTNIGITLLSFFDGNSHTPGVFGGLDSTIAALNKAETDSVFLRQPYVEESSYHTANDLAFWGGSAPRDIRFNSSRRALTGSATVDLSQFTGIPTAGTSGTLIAGRSDSNPIVLGQWQVSAVPEPSSLLLFAIKVGVVFRRRRPRKQLTSGMRPRDIGHAVERDLEKAIQIIREGG